MRKKRGGSRYDKMKDDYGAKAGTREQETGINFARRVESAPHSISTGGVGTSVSYSMENDSAAVMEITSLRTGQEGVTAKSNEYARTDFAKFMLVHQKKLESEANKCVATEPLKTLSERAVDETVQSKRQGAGVGSFRQGTDNTGLERFHYRRVFREDSEGECFVLKEMRLAAKRL